MKRYKPEDNIFVTEYFSLNEFITEIDSLPNNRFMQYVHESQQTYSSDNNWSGTTDYQRATYLLTHGWDAEAKKMSSKVKPIALTQSTVKSSKPAYSVVGSQASVPRYLQGIPTNMVNRQMIHSKQKVITLTKGISYSGRIKPEHILQESIKALQIIQAIETGGQRVRLNVMVATTYNNKHTICKVCIKQPDERMNISKMAFALAHPSMLRRFFFKWFEVDPFIDFNIGSGFGYPSTSYIKEKAMTDTEYYLPEEIPDMDKLISEIKSGKPRRTV